MSKFKISSCLIFLLLFSCSAHVVTAGTSSLEEKRILLLYSYHASFPTSAKVIDGIRAGFRDSLPVIEIEYMDSKRLHNDVSQANFLNYLNYKLSDRPDYNLIITVDDNALDFTLEHREKLFPNVPVVFLGVNDILKARLFSSSSFATGVVEAAPFAETIKLSQQLFPQRNTIQILVDGTTSGQSDLITIRSLKSQFTDLNFQEIDLTKHSWQSVADKISSLGKSDSLILLSAYRDLHGKFKSFSESLSYITQNSKVPIFHMWEHGIGEGVLGGIVVSHREQGKQAALLAKRILSGEPVSKIEIVQRIPNTPTFDAWQLSRFGVPQRQLPPNSQIEFQPITFWDKYRLEIIIAITLFFFLLLISLYLAHTNIRMRRLGNELREKSSFLRLLMDTLPDLVWIKDKDGVYLGCNKRFEQLYGATEEEIIGQTDYDFVDKELADFFREKDKLAIKIEGQSLNEEQLEFRSDGHVETVETINTPVFTSEHGSLLGVLGVGRDITERKEAEIRRRELLDSSLDGIVILTKDFGVIEANKSWAGMLGYTPQEMLELHAWDWDATMSEQEIRERFPASLNSQYRFETRHRSKDGKLFDVEVSLSGTEINGEPVHIAIVRDIRERKESEVARKALLDSSLDGIAILNKDFRIIEANARISDMLGYSHEELLKLHAWDWDVEMSEHELRERLTPSPDLRVQFETRHRHKDGSIFDVEVSLSGAIIKDEPVLISIVRDIRERKEQERLKDLRQRLADMVHEHDQEQLMQTALDTAELMLDSKIGFFHFVEKDQQQISLQTWSTRTLNELCHAAGEGYHYPVDIAGVWADCIRQRQPVIHNDYKALSHKNGLPEGHAPVIRELTVPVFRGDKIVAVMGVGNKEDEYDEHDIEIALNIAETGYSFVERKRAEEQIQYMAFNDVLTGLPNRELFADRLHQAASMSHRLGTILAIGYLDLDGFKQINDQNGHAVGDQLLISLARRLEKDLREGDTLARLGGDEFVILLGGLESVLHGEKIIQRVLKSIAQPFDLEHHRLHISASIGVTIYPQDSSDPDTLLRHADQAMYKAKESGKNTYRLYDPIHDSKIKTHRRAINEFEKAIHESQLRLHYQPRIELKSGKVCGVESLVRWQHPDKGLLSPADFLPTIKGSPVETKLDEWVLQRALEQHLSWRELGLTLPVSVNISPHTIQQPSFPEYLGRLLLRYPGDVSDYLELEILETSAIGDTANVAEIMNACANLGVQFSLDDFGTGYSSLTYFHRLPISILKIDRSFVRDMLTDQRDHDIVDGVLNLSKALNRPVVAEGVESIEIGAMLLQLGCRYAQGYAIAKPMSPEELFEWSTHWLNEELWHKLSVRLKQPTQYSDLNVAFFTHNIWMEKVISQIQSDTEAPSMDMVSCQLSRWYHGIGTSRFGHHEQFPFIEAKHRAVHKLGIELVQLAEKEGREAALVRLDELMAASRELTEILGRLAETKES